MDFARTSPPTLKEVLQQDGDGHNFMAGRVTIPKVICTVGTLDRPSDPGFKA